MAVSASLPAATPAGRHAAAVYVAAVPLRGPKGPAQALMSAGYSLGLWDLQHFMVLLRPDPARAQALVFDFQPRDPEDALAAFAVLSRSEIPGVVRRRTLRRVPDTRCWLVGHHRSGGGAGAAAAVLAAEAFHRAVADRPGRRAARLPRLHQRCKSAISTIICII
ncbi:hypothetical protein OsJ_07317 [Oryza sativa Japonica Group]|uniref:Uncharacterized protein n=1 Tax=Oryza sativa subsp. japonica TaxID=39947 RepID=B9F0S9_ORYSJ|nr:hypothetical protein OsJ_07317 [Oryza sativa Japonica Group]